MTYHLDHTEPWPVWRTQSSSHLERLPEDAQKAEVKHQSPCKKVHPLCLLPPRRDKHQEPHLEPTGLGSALALRASAGSRKCRESPKNPALYQDGSEAGKWTHIFWIEPSRRLAVVGQEPGHLFPQAVGRPERLCGAQAQGPFLSQGLGCSLFQRARHQPHVTGILTDAINSPGDADDKCESLDENSGLLNYRAVLFLPHRAPS